MMQPKPIFIQDVFADIVSKVSAELTAQLKLADEHITGVHYEYGTGLEIINTLQQKSQAMPFDKYPCVCLFLDVQEQKSSQAGIYSAISDLRIAIVYGTNQNYKAAQRDIYSFKPILTPIYQELLTQMKYICAFQQPYLGFEHDMTRNYFWGSQGLYGKEGNIFDDKLDAINLTFRDLKILESYCPTGC